MNENNDKTIESNIKTIKSNTKTVIDGLHDINDRVLAEEESENTDNKTIPGNGCKVCTDEDLSTQFFASGPFYAIESAVERMSQNIHKRSDGLDRRERSEECNVLYAEMPQLFGEDNQLSDNQRKEHIKTICCGEDSTQAEGSDKHLMVDHNYQFVCYNCCSPLSVAEDSQMDHNLYYISSDESKPETDDRINDEELRSGLSSPLVFCRESVENIDINSVKEESILGTGSERLSKYTTVIKPKAVRPLLTPNTSQMSGHSTTDTISTTHPTLSFHGSVNVLTDSDESAFTQIPRRRSNSEATHHYHSITSNDTNCQMPSNRPLINHQRSKSVNKGYNNLDNTLGFTKCQAFSDKQLTRNTNNVYLKSNYFDENKLSSNQRTSSQSNSYSEYSEPIHMTLEEVRHIFTKNQSKRIKNNFLVQKHKRNASESEDRNSLSKSKSKSKIKSAIESLFRNKRKSGSPVPSSECNSIDFDVSDRTPTKESEEYVLSNHCSSDSSSPFAYRALPPIPLNNNDLQNTNDSCDKEAEEHQKFLDYAASIERVKDCGWYWGPISGEMAEKLLASEPCGSFIVRDSSDEHYIFSLTFKLNGLVRHVRIEHDQGNFSFGSLQKFRSNTIVDFIENAVQHSRSGRFLFFLHRRPVMGPMRVQLLHPVSRFKQIQSLQHICRFIILKHVRRDLIEELPLPRMLKTYLNTPYYYSEELALMSKDEPKPELNQSLPPISSHSEDI